MHANECFVDFILKRANPDDAKEAMTFQDEAWSYGRLKQEIDALKTVLVNNEVQPGDRVIIRMDAEPIAIAMSLAIMSYGAIYVPIATDIPNVRFLSIIDAVAPSLIVCARDAAEDYGAEECIELDTIKLHRMAGSPPTDTSHNQDDKDAYIIMTSGTTGVPKGITMTHSAAIAAIKGYHEMSIDADNRVGSISPLHFDFCIFDMAITFYFGATLVLVPKILAHYAKGFIKYLNEHSITRMHSIPSVWRPVLDSSDANILNSLTTLKSVLYAAESFPVKDLLTLQSKLPNAEFVQSFGHTESMGCCFKKLSNPICAHKGCVSIGKPLLNTEMFVINDQGDLAQAEEVGELYIKGPHLFRGYWCNPEQTNRSLVADPRGDEGITFKSGDLVFQDANDDFYFVGRCDHQVKIGGNRIELPEIDRVINEISDVSAATTIVNDNEGRKTIECFIVNKSSLDWREFVLMVRKNVSQLLPRYMMPTDFYAAHSLPLLSNGKVDRSVLKDVNKRKEYLVNKGVSI
ncbi:amino acid adenylation domain-containing protein [Thalassolituus maritimus]|uniref:Amino acid adenylation domain-containing protein n=1 Tax=Thalassolituus maritimus TaxID=484498 RepID=A0A1N7Q974_9GAMM|nr:AMP-binding protein [Thalassolituus maritimus]SIT19398.1 amino acid adenylation domain-containing protein [Thalassolituus maritimus]